MIRSTLLLVFTFSFASKAFLQHEKMHLDTLFARQNLEYAYKISQKDSQIDSAVYYANQSVEIYKKYFGDDCLQIAEANRYLAIFFSQKGMLERSIELDLKALEITTKIIGYENIRVSNILLNLGFWYQAFDMGLSLQYSEECLSVRKRIYGEVHHEVATTYLNIAATYWKTGDYPKAIDYNLKALSILKQLPERNELLIANTNTGLANIYAELGQYDKVNRLYEEALAIRLAHLGPKNVLVARTYSNLGHWYLEQKRYEDALECHTKSLQIRQEILTPDNPDIATSYNNLGLVLDAIGLIDSAIVCFQHAIAIREKKLSLNHARIGSAYFNMGECYSHKGDINQAILCYKKAFPIQLANVHTVGPDCMATLERLVQALLQQNRNLEVKELFDNLELTQSPILYPHSLHGKIQLLQMKGRYFSSVYDTRDGEQVARALTPFEEMDELLSSDQYLSWPNELREHFINDISKGYFSGAQACIKAWKNTQKTDYLYRAFKYAEKSKAFFLYGKLKDESAKLKAGIPDSLLQLERRLYAEITLFENKINDEINKGANTRDSLVTVWRGRVFDLKETLAAFKKSLEDAYPRYYQLKYALGAIPVSYLRDSLLQPDQALIEYFTGDSAILVFLITSDTFSVVEIPKNFPLESWATQLHQAISEYGRMKNAGDRALNYSIGRYIDMADSLYQKLLLPFASKLPESLIIIPDGVLGRVPFETLLEKKPANRYYYKDYAWFGKKHIVSYCYSATLLCEMRNKTHRNSPLVDFIGFAPYYTGDTTLLASLYGDDFSVRKDLAPLPDSGKELFAIQKIMGGVPYYGEEATEVRFLKEAEKARVIHLATHARADNRVGDYAWLAFHEIKDSIENELIYVRDLYNLTLNADMVVLSACETGLGPLKQGEGIVSLARAFAYAGAKSIVTTLWNVNDARTAEIMILFYTNLKKGMPAAKALWQSKKDYLESKEDYKAHPYYWGGLIGIGL